MFPKLYFYWKRYYFDKFDNFFTKFVFRFLAKVVLKLKRLSSSFEGLLNVLKNKLNIIGGE